MNEETKKEKDLKQIIGSCIVNMHEKRTKNIDTKKS